jgi:thiamine biosynthesis lipoprotein
MDAVELDPGALTVAFTRPGIELDLGGLAKGHALDVAGAIIREAGIRRGILHAGTSSVVAIGAPEDQPDGFRIALGAAGGGATTETAAGAGVVTLRDAAMSVSAPHGRAVECEGEILTHILDPRTGGPSTTPVRLAAVVGPSGAITEAWSTALVVLGDRPPEMPPELVSVVHPHLS